VVDDADTLIAVTPETFRKERNIDARVLHEVTEIDLKGRRVRVRRLDEATEWWE
jgi:hypothetical protein